MELEQSHRILQCVRYLMRLIRKIYGQRLQIFLGYYNGGRPLRLSLISMENILFGHGYKNLSVVLAFLMMLAFLVDQPQLLSCKLLQAGLIETKRFKELYKSVRGLFEHFIFQNLRELHEAIAYGFEATLLIKIPTIKST